MKKTTIWKAQYEPRLERIKKELSPELYKKFVNQPIEKQMIAIDHMQQKGLFNLFSFPKDEYGYTHGNVYATKIHEFNGKFILDVANTGVGGEWLFKKTFNNRKDAEEAEESYLKVKIY
jgi:hypothetical protein